MSLYLTRHGQTDWNKADVTQGRIDIPLNETGISEAYKLKEKLKDIHLDVIYCSPLIRARKTTEIINEGRNIPVVLEPKLMEMYYGQLERKPRTSEEYLSQRKRFATRYPGGESYLDVAARVFPFLNYLNSTARDKDILLVCHGGISRVISAYFRPMENDEFIYFGMDNCGLLKFEFPDLPPVDYYEDDPD
ncbi:MAG: histidine phosphatase family protein [Bacilli bacterium]|nr:histidine phosphatase family protein [Bacilli bacterium]